MMRVEDHPLAHGTPGTQRRIEAWVWGAPEARPKLYIQAALHADELPGVLVAEHLRNLLDAAAARGELHGRIVLVPAANPIGLSQRVLGEAHGRFHLADGVNFNRQFPHLTDVVADSVAGMLGADASANVRVIRAALGRAIHAQQARTEVEAQRLCLMRLAHDADYVLDLHCDGESVLHLYTGTRLVDALDPLARLLGVQATLTADVSGEHPFDESLSRIWWELAARFPACPIPSACMSATVELRGQADVTDDLAAQDARALCGFARHIGALAGPPVDLPEPTGQVTPLAAVAPLRAPHAGVLVFGAKPGERVRAGQPVADIYDPVARLRTPVLAETSGLLFARAAVRFVAAGQRIAKIAGNTPMRSGALLSP